ncbi:MAG: hypothetical protein R3F43_10805 [bacterium]
MRMRSLVIALAVATFTAPALAEEACGDVVEVEGPRLLRQMTLDLYGRPHRRRARGPGRRARRRGEGGRPAGRG